MRHRQLTGRAGSPGQRGVGPDAQAEANRLGIAILGHLPAGVDTVRAACLGMRSVEHLGPGVGILSCCSTDEERVRGAAKGRPLPTGSGPDAAAFMTEVLAQLVINPVNSNTPDDKANLAHALDTFSDERVKELAAVFSETSTWQVPTLVRLLSEQLCDDEAFPVDPDLRCIAPSVVESWQRAADTFARFPDADRATLRRAYQRHLDITRTFAAAGVPMLTGTAATTAPTISTGSASASPRHTAAGRRPPHLAHPICALAPLRRSSGRFRLVEGLILHGRNHTPPQPAGSPSATMRSSRLRIDCRKARRRPGCCSRSMPRPTGPRPGR